MVASIFGDALSDSLKDASGFNHRRGMNRRLYPAADVAVMASTTRDLSKNEDERESLESAAKERVESNRTWAAVTDPLPQLYRDLISARSA